MEINVSEIGTTDNYGLSLLAFGLASSGYRAGFLEGEHDEGYNGPSD
jgi:hypothetical protein